jgi:hypothetical protein
MPFSEEDYQRVMEYLEEVTKDIGDIKEVSNQVIKEVSNQIIISIQELPIQVVMQEETTPRSRGLVRSRSMMNVQQDALATPKRTIRKQHTPKKQPCLKNRNMMNHNLRVYAIENRIAIENQSKLNK